MSSRENTSTQLARHRELWGGLGQGAQLEWKGKPKSKCQNARTVRIVGKIIEEHLIK